MVLINIEKDDETLSKTQKFVDKTFTSSLAQCINGGFPEEPPDSLTTQLGLKFIPFYTLVDRKGVIVYNGGFREDLFEMAKHLSQEQ